MPIEYDRSNRPKLGVYTENMMLTLCILSLIPVILTVVGLILIVPLFNGFRNSLKDGHSRSIQGTTQAIQFLVMISVVALGYNMFTSHNKLQSSLRDLYEDIDNFPHKKDMEIHSSMTPYAFTMKYGAEASEAMDRIIVNDYSATSRFNNIIREDRTEFENAKLYFAISIFYLFILHAGWAWPLSNKINAGEWKLKVQAPPKRGGKVITGSEGLRGYSIADELIKWTALKEKGVISNEEHEAARTRLIGGTGG